MNADIKEALDEMTRWNEGDLDSFSDGAVPFDGKFVFIARRKTIERLRKLLDKPTKAD